jgi:hypothetical protein
MNTQINTPTQPHPQGFDYLTSQNFMVSIAEKATRADIELIIAWLKIEAERSAARTAARRSPPTNKTFPSLSGA